MMRNDQWISVCLVPTFASEEGRVELGSVPNNQPSCVEAFSRMLLSEAFSRVVFRWLLAIL